MALGSFAGLKASIATWLDRTDLTTVIEDFIVLAEARIGRDLRVRTMETRSQMTTLASTEYYGLPTGYVSARSLKLQNGDIKFDLEYMSPENIEQYSGTGSTYPRYYTIVGEELRLVPTHGSGYVVEVVYYKQPTALDDTNTSNTTFAKSPDIYLYAALLEGATFLKDREAAMGYGTLYGQAISAAQSADTKDRHGGGVLQVHGGHRGK